MQGRGIGFVVGLIAAGLLLAGTALAVEPEIKCESTKNKEAGKFSSCLQKSHAKHLKTGDDGKYLADVKKCNDKFFLKWGKEEEKVERQSATCPDGIADPNKVADFVTDSMDCVVSLLSGAGWGGCSICPARGAAVGGSCWYLGDPNANCDTTCDNAGLVYDEATRTYAGDLGSLANCQAVMDALFPLWPYPFGDFDECPEGWGCISGGLIENLRCTNVPTNSTAAVDNGLRACACK